MSDTTKILKCSCEHEYQDKKYGKGMRVGNLKAGAKTGPVLYRCTVCGRDLTSKGGSDG